MASQETEVYAGLASDNVVVRVVALLRLVECCSEELITLRPGVKSYIERSLKECDA